MICSILPQEGFKYWVDKKVSIEEEIAPIELGTAEFIKKAKEEELKPLKPYREICDFLSS